MGPKKEQRRPPKSCFGDLLRSLQYRPMPDLTGQTLGGYRILNQIGKGGMATVYRAFQPSLERYVAVKVLPAYYAEQDESFLERFRLEARSIARLRHPNILTIYEYGEQEGVTFIVMEYV